MNKILNNSITASLLWGVIGGALLILIKQLSRNGLLGMLPYVFILILALVTLKSPAEKKFFTFFMTGLLTFLVMTVILYAEIIFIENPAVINMPLLGHAWRLGVILLIGSASSATLTYLILLKR